MSAKLAALFLLSLLHGCNGVVAYDIKAAYVAEGWRGIAAVNQLPAGVFWISYLLRAMQLL